MVKFGAAILGGILGGLAAVVGIISYFSWGSPRDGQVSHVDPTRSDYVDLLLTLITIFLASIGLAVTVGALVIGLVALKSFREIKEDAADSAKAAAESQITETISAKLEPNVTENVNKALPQALRDTLLKDEIGHRILTEMARSGALDGVLERVVSRLQTGGVDIPSDEMDDESEHA